MTEVHGLLIEYNVHWCNSELYVECRCTCLSFSCISKADVIGLAMKGRIWLTKASRVRSSVWRVGGKRPGKSSLVASRIPSLFSFVI